MSKLTKDEIFLLDNSVERVLSTAMKLIKKHVPNYNEDKQTNLRDLEDCKSIVVDLWNTARNEAFKKANPA
jgi:hypothetical protein